jgi:hypothetical protein
MKKTTIPKKSISKKPMILALVASLTLGLAPFVPEPHVIGKWRWLLGGANGMQPMDWFDLILHTTPFVLFIYFTISYFLEKRKAKEN